MRKMRVFQRESYISVDFDTGSSEIIKVKNYDGKNKHHTLVGENVFIGSNTTLIAPMKIGNASIVAAGSVINRNGPSESLAIARPIQQNKIGFGKKIMLKLEKLTDKMNK